MMAKSREYMSHYPENPPEWYWINGLHDAGIIGVEVYEFPFDYNKFVGEKSKYDRNLLILKINSKNALYDNSVEEIHFYNYMILSSDISLEHRKTIWWLADRLTVNENHYIIEIDLQDFDAYPEDFTFKIKFEKAEVKRK
ncbi:MAG: hypothetical protein IIW43_01990 [Selenomonadales bacterium]|nr:hypothetical protein [Selenomonadales bacterium]